MPRTTLPPLPMTSRILSTGMWMVSMRGAVSRISPRGAGDLGEHRVENERAALARLLESAGEDVDRQALALLSICKAVMPFSVPQTLKSMSPRKSSIPWMSVKMTTSSPSLIRPMATPETGALMGTPASMRANVEPQVEAIEEEPLDSRTSETTRMA